MAKVSIAELKSYFETGDRPTQQQFWNFLDSYIHKDEGYVITSTEIQEDDLIFNFSNGSSISVPIFNPAGTQEPSYIDGLVEFMSTVNNFMNTLVRTDNNFTNQFKQDIIDIKAFFNNLTYDGNVRVQRLDVNNPVPYGSTGKAALFTIPEVIVQKGELIRLFWKVITTEANPEEGIEEVVSSFETVYCIPAGTYEAGADWGSVNPDNFVIIEIQLVDGTGIPKLQQVIDEGAVANLNSENFALQGNNEEGGTKGAFVINGEGVIIQGQAGKVKVEGGNDGFYINTQGGNFEMQSQGSSIIAKENGGGGSALEIKSHGGTSIEFDKDDSANIDFASPNNLNLRGRIVNLGKKYSYPDIDELDNVFTIEDFDDGHESEPGITNKTKRFAYQGKSIGFGMFAAVSSSPEEGVYLVHRNFDGSLASVITAIGGNIDFTIQGGGSVTINGKALKPYRVFSAIVNQSGTDAPVFTAFQDDFDNDISFIRNSAGDYTIKSDLGVFASDKTSVTVSNLGDDVTDGSYASRIIYDSDTEIFLQTAAANAKADGVLFGTLIEIKVYN